MQRDAELTFEPSLVATQATNALAATSTRGWIKRLGTRWVSLHRAVYAAGALAVLHHFWLVKADYRPAIVHGALLAGLLGARMVWKRRAKVGCFRTYLDGRQHPTPEPTGPVESRDLIA